MNEREVLGLNWTSGTLRSLKEKGGGKYHLKERG